MKTELAIYHQADAVCCALLEDGQPVELLIDDRRKQLRRHDVLLGQVRQVATSLNAVFIDIGEPHDAMLPQEEAGQDIKPGQRLIVQIKRATAAGKGHQVTARIQLPGPFAVFNSEGPPMRRSKLQSFALAKQRALFAQDLARLRDIWQDIQQQSRIGPAPRLLLAAGDPLTTALTSFVSDSLANIQVEGDDLFAQVYTTVQNLMPPYLPLLSLFMPTGSYGLAAALSLTDLPQRLNDRKVWLDNGGFLIIDRTEALTVIDVNSGKDIRGRDNTGLRLRTNLLAAGTIARQLRLRNLGGMIIIDFIDLKDMADREALLDTFRAALARDRARCRVVGFTSLGLLEMTRSAV
jgi:ribonuclease G